MSSTSKLGILLDIGDILLYRLETPMLDGLAGNQIHRGFQLAFDAIRKVYELDADRSIEIDDDVYVAVRLLITPCVGPEDPDGTDMEPPSTPLPPWPASARGCNGSRHLGQASCPLSNMHSSPQASMGSLPIPMSSMFVRK
jgi:hypothetical protein